MAMADVGDQRAFLVTAMKFSEGEQRAEQIQQIVDCACGHADRAPLRQGGRPERTGLLFLELLDNGNVVFGPDQPK